MITTMVFDWGGVMANDRDKTFYVEVAALVDLPYDQIWDYWLPAFRELKRGNLSEAAFWNAIETAVGKVLPRSKYDIWDRWSALNAYPEMLQFLTMMRSKGYQMVLLSNTVGPVVERWRARGYFEYFDTVVVSNEAHLVKPDPKIYELTLQYAGALPNQCIMIDDLQRNLDPAAEMGFKTILAQSSEQIVHDINYLLIQG